MAITVMTGPPGAGKSHALVKDVIVPAILAGRRVVSNIDGLDADAVRGYCIERLGPMDDADHLGEVVTFDGQDALKPGFFPDESTAEGSTFVRGGDLVVFDEWALYFARRGNEKPGCNVEAFLRWHRHLTGPNGQATDIAIGTQVPADINQAYRSLIVKSYKFKKLTALGTAGTYAWLLFDGHLQPKGGHYRNGTGKYDREIFPLYASSAAAKDGTHVELKTNKKESVWSGWQPWAFIAVPLLFIPIGAWKAYSFFVPGEPVSATGAPVAGAGGVPAPAVGPIAPGSPAPIASTSNWRIVGQIDGVDGARVIVVDNSGGVRMMKPDAFDFDQGRAVSGTIEGKRAYADDRMPSAGQGSPFGGLLQ